MKIYRRIEITAFRSRVIAISDDTKTAESKDLDSPESQQIISATIDLLKKYLIIPRETAVDPSVEREGE